MKTLSCYLVLLFLMSRQGCSGELRLLQIVFHQGHQVSEEAPSRDPYRVFLQTGPGKLALIGMIQLFRLGQRMRRKYSDFVTAPPTQEVDLYPSQRGAPCSSLSECFMTGFYRPNKDHPPPGDSSWQQHNYKPSTEDQSEETSELRCPRLQTAAARLYEESEEGIKTIEQFSNLYHYLSSNSGMEIRNPTDARELYENLQLEKSLNLSLPSWAERFWPELKRQSDIHFTWLAQNQEMQKMAAGPLLGLLLTRIERHIDGYDRKQYFVYSGKNSSLAGLLAIFGAFDGREPSFGSTLVLETHRFGATYYVRVLYFYSTKSDAPEVITLRGCSEYCPYDKFKMLTTGMVPLTWQRECKWSRNGDPGTAPKQLIFAAGLVWILLAFVY